MTTANTETDRATEAGASVASTDGFGWAFATDDQAEEWIWGGATREACIVSLLDTFEDGGWITPTRPVNTTDDEVEEHWTFVCTGTRERILPNNSRSAAKERSD